MKQINCKFCQNSCKVKGKTECDKYNPIAAIPSQLETKIREAYKNGDYELANRLQDKLFRFFYG